MSRANGLRAFDVDLDDQAPAGFAILSDLIFQRVEEVRIPMARPISDAFVVKDKSAAVADWPRWIETIVLVHWNVISPRDLASPIIVCADAVRVSCIERLTQVLAHEVSAIVGAAEAFERTVFQSDRLKFCKNRLAQLAPGPVVHDTPNHDDGDCESEDDERDPNPRLFPERVLHR